MPILSKQALCALHSWVPWCESGDGTEQGRREEKGERREMRAVSSHECSREWRFCYSPCTEDECRLLWRLVYKAPRRARAGKRLCFKKAHSYLRYVVFIFCQSTTRDPIPSSVVQSRASRRPAPAPAAITNHMSDIRCSSAALLES